MAVFCVGAMATAETALGAAVGFLPFAALVSAKSQSLKGPACDGREDRNLGCRLICNCLPCACSVAGLRTRWPRKLHTIPPGPQTQEWAARLILWSFNVGGYLICEFHEIPDEMINVLEASEMKAQP